MSRTRVDLRLDEGLLSRLDVRAGELGQTRTKFIERAVESALRVPSLDSLGPSPSPALVKASAEESSRKSTEARAVRNVAGAMPSAVLGRCPKATCSQTGLVGGTCPDHRNLRFKA
jgi:hypothetical protein